MTAELFTRTGEPFDAAAHTLSEKKGKSGYWSYSPCYRCGGAGGFKQWPGFTCYRCGGQHSRTYEQHFERVYSAEQLAKLNAAQAKRDVKKAAKLAAKKAEHDAHVAAQRATLEATHSLLLARAANVRANTFVADILTKANERGTLSDKQLAALESAVAREEARTKSAAESVYFGTPGERIKDIPVTVSHVAKFERENRYDYNGGMETVYIVTMMDGAGHCFVSKSSHFGFAVTAGDAFLLSATVKDHSDYKGMKQTIVQRVKTREL